MVDGRPQVCIAAVNFVAGFLLVVGSRIMAEIPETKAAQAVLVHFFRAVPPFNLGALPPSPPGQRPAVPYPARGSSRMRG